jgi:hypothetical protein
VAIASASGEARELKIEFPEIPGAPLPMRRLSIRTPAPLATNEDSEQVAVVEEPVVVLGHGIAVHLPAYGFAVLLPEEHP